MNLNEMKEVKCSECKQDVIVNFYYSAPTISEEDDHWNGCKFFRATVNAQATCPNCGKTIIKIYRNDITPAQIVKLAIEERQDN